MEERFLLYIDILGFSEMTQNDPRKVARVYSILDKLNAHQHYAFKTIVFSDTILVYNPTVVVSQEDKEYLVWYLIEFVEDLQHRLVGQDVYFRAVITKGSFQHYPLKNIECFYGSALIEAYSVEKKIPSIGLFINNDCLLFNRYFPVEKYDDRLSFVYLSRSFEHLEMYTGGVYPFKDPYIADQAPYAPWDIRILQDIYVGMRNHKAPSVRVKYLAAWDLYLKRYQNLVNFLVQNQFSLEKLGGKKAWEEEHKRMEAEIRYFKRIGSGTKLSQGIVSSFRAKRRKP